MIEVHPLKAFTDNYIWALVSKESIYIVDPGDPNPVINFIENNCFTLEGILITHHHFDHTGGIKTLVDKFEVPVYGPKGGHIDGITNELVENDRITVLGESFKIFEVPGHTLDHIAYYSDSNQKLLFCGDTLFSGGCGRLFEGTPDQMHESLNKLKKLHPETLVFCTHEYTKRNLDFALVVDDQNDYLKDYSLKVKNLREQDKITLPSSIKKELQINPFLRLDSKDIIFNASKHASISISNEIETLKTIREWKDNF